MFLALQALTAAALTLRGGGQWAAVQRSRFVSRAGPPLCTDQDAAVPAVATEPSPPVVDEAMLGAARLNEELRVTVTYSSGPQGRARRVRRTKRPSLEERWRSSAADIAGFSRMSAFCNFGSINLEEAVGVLEREERLRAFGERISIVAYADVVRARWTDSAGEHIDAFLFPYGAIVLWGFTSEQELDLLAFLSECGATEPIIPANPRWVHSSAPTTAAELADFEFMLFNRTEPNAEVVSQEMQKASISNNVIELRTSDPTEQLAISFAFAQSCKLTVLENALEDTVEEIRQVPEQLSRSGRCQFSAKQIAKLTGRVFLERNEVNLYSNILDCPDFFWEAEAFEPLYRRFNRYLDIEDRVGILNNRLDIVNDLLESLAGQLEIRNSHRLEIIIIILILIEIMLEVGKDVALHGFPNVPRLARLPFAGLSLLWGRFAESA